MGLLGTQYPQPSRTLDAFGAAQNTPLGYNTLADYWDNYLAREAAFRKPVGSYTSYALAPQEGPPGMSGAIAANPDVYRPRYAGSDDFGEFGDPYGGDDVDTSGGLGGGFSSLGFGYNPEVDFAENIANLGTGFTIANALTSGLGLLSGPLGLAARGLSYYAEPIAYNNMLDLAYQETGLPGQHVAISRGSNPFASLADLALAEEESFADVAAAVTAANQPGAPTWGEEPADFGGLDVGGFGRGPGAGTAEEAYGGGPGGGSGAGSGGDAPDSSDTGGVGGGGSGGGDDTGAW